MVKFYKFLSVLLHPIVIPTIGTLFFLLLTPDIISVQKQYVAISIVFITTYFIPLIALILLKSLGVIQNFQVQTIKERKIPIILMLVIFFVLGKLFYSIVVFKELGILFFATDFALFIVYFLFFLKIKTSLHILSMSSAIAFILIFSAKYALVVLPLIAVLFLLTGLLASARLHLKAHKKTEIYWGFLIGFVCPIVVFYMF